MGSFLLRARALFSAETVARVRDLVEIPEPMPFSGIKVETVRVPRTGAPSTWRSCSKAPGRSWPAPGPSNTRSSFLGALAGLRRNEIDVLRGPRFAGMKA